MCLGSFLTFFALWALAFAVELSTTSGKENYMDTRITENERPKNLVSSLANTIWAIGTSALSGLALSG
jgi:hypothetical protein